jgi:hypothetical protein
MGSRGEFRERRSAWRYASAVAFFRIRASLMIELSTRNGRYPQGYE